ncbi:T9SS C-terminal target domain-containing protein [Paenimyroides tangerinum]|uniref:T9SS C-terminal target domain-containing protein n=1 Tax=Paenimyroides tangerinum TaxID=2488728 RepID=A0A3P3WFR3_9FLAO|nr:T9SS type A sorting domain-containing protein [Paenimyroides tangerinum]RRJ92439.1 T9SS C-terminal target domain-containing protein [Paenimyroides tangerinum]
MKKIYLLYLMLFLPLVHYGQINQSYNWDTDLQGWVTSGDATMATTTIGCASSGAVRTNIYYDFWDDLTYSPNFFRSPLLSNSNGDPVTVEFLYQAVNFNFNAPTSAALAGSFEIQLQWSSSTSGPWTNFATITAPSLSCASYSATFTPGISDVYIRFVTNLLDDDEDLQIYFDELNIYQGPPPTCINPTNIVMTAVTSNSATINWTAPSVLPNNGYIYEVRTDTNPGTPGAALIASGATGAGVTLANVSTLSANTQYNVYVRANCGAGDLSGWSNVSTFRTLCLPFTAPYTENFDSYTAGAFPTCWLRPILYSGYPSIVASNFSTSPNSLRFQSLTTIPTYAITPAFSQNIETLRVKFNLKREGASSGQIEVGLMSDPSDLSTFVLIQSINPPDNIYHEYVIPFNGSTVTGANRYIAFKHVSGANNWYYWLDDVIVEPIPLCPDMTGVAVSNITKNTTTISWNGLTPEPANGYAYEIRTSGLPGTAGAIQSGTVAAGIHFKDLINLLPSTEYFVYVRSVCSATQFGIWSDGRAFKTMCDYPELVLATPASICGEGTVNLSASFNSGTLNWYGSQTGGISLGTGNSFTTPVINSTTSYWVDSSLLGTSVFGGKALPGDVSSTTASTYGLVFDAYSGFILETVDVYLASATAGNIVINLTNSSGTVIETRTVAVPAGNATTPVLHTITLDLNVPAGVGYRLLAITSPSLVRDTTGNTFPYVLGSLGSITGGYLSGASTSYYYFYNWSIKSNCTSPRTEVIATVTPAPVLTLSTNQVQICEGDSSLVTVTAGASDYNTFVWSPTTGVTGNATTGWTFNPTVSTLYVLTASQTGGSQCVFTTGVNVGVNSLPEFTPLDTTYDVCANVVQELNTNLVAIKEYVIGTGTTTTSTSDIPTAFMNRWPQTKQQYIYTKDELNAIGIYGGNIDYLAFRISSLGSGATNNNYTIKMKSVAESNFANSNFLTVGFTTVYGPVTHTHTATGWQEFNLTTPFIWNGNSNVLIELTHLGADSSNNAETFYSVTTDNKGLGAQGASALSAVSGTLTTKRLNIRFKQDGSSTATWSPQTNLYLDQAATQPYTGGHATKVYVKSSQTGSTVYTVNMVTDKGCSANLTTTVNVTEVSTPVAADQTFCDETDVADIVVTGLAGANMKWFDSATATSEITSVATSGTYFVEQELNGCVSARVSVDIDINGVNVAPVTNATQTFCGSYTVADLVATPLTGNTIGWFDSATSTTPLAVTTVLATGNYYVSQYNGSCWSPKAEVSVTVGSVPAAPVNVAQVFCGNKYLSEIDLGQGANATLNWYQTATSINVLPMTTQLVTGTHAYYVSQTINGCESSRVEIQVNIQQQLLVPVAPEMQLYCVVIQFSDLEVTASVGGIIGWFASDISTTPIDANQDVVTGTYYVAQYNGACWSDKTTVQVTVGNKPSAPSSDNVQLCGNYNFGQVSIGQISGATLKWYETSTSTTPLGSSTNVVGGTYFVSQTVGGCESDRAMVVISQTDALNNPTVVSQSFCGSATVADLVAQGTAGATIVWYNSSVALNPLSSNAALATGTYYAAQTVNGCISSRVPISVFVVSIAAPNVDTFNFCGGATVANLVLPTPTGVVYKWFDSPSNPTQLDANIALVSGTYFVSRTQYGCESLRTPVTVNINSVPDAPTGISPQVFIEGSTINDILMDQPNVVWYMTQQNAQNGVNPLVQGMPLVNGTTYYGVIIGTNGCPSLPFALTVDVYLSDDKFVKEDLKYYPNPVEDILNVTYSERILQIEVFDLLGKRVKVKSTDDKEVNIDLSDLASGTYMIQLKTESKQQFIKVVKK